MTPGQLGSPIEWVRFPGALDTKVETDEYSTKIFALWPRRWWQFWKAPAEWWLMQQYFTDAGSALFQSRLDAMRRKWPAPRADERMM